MHDAGCSCCSLDCLLSYSRADGRKSLFSALSFSAVSLVDSDDCLLQMSASEFGEVQPPITAEGPQNVTDELTLTQSLVGVKDDGTADTRGYKPSPIGAPNSANTSQVAVGAPGRISPAASQYGISADEL